VLQCVVCACVCVCAYIHKLHVQKLHDAHTYHLAINQSTQIHNHHPNSDQSHPKIPPTEQDMRVRIADFGCARQMSGESYESSTISGSPQYMPPEQVTQNMRDKLLHVCFCIYIYIYIYTYIQNMFRFPKLRLITESSTCTFESNTCTFPKECSHVSHCFSWLDCLHISPWLIFPMKFPQRMHGWAHAHRPEEMMTTCTLDVFSKERYDCHHILTTCACCHQSTAWMSSAKAMSRSTNRTSPHRRVVYLYDAINQTNTKLAAFFDAPACLQEKIIT
jgi:serine/threonine protein kinase